MNQKMALLTEEERARLIKELRTNNITAVSLCLFGIMLIVFIYIIRNEELINLWKYILAVLCAIICTFILTRKFTNSIREEITSNSKIIEEFEIEQRYSYDDREDRFSQEKKKYIIVANGTKYNVTEEQYNQSANSNLLLVHKTSKREVVINVEITNRP